MLGRVSIKVFGLFLIAMSILLGSLVSQFRGTSIMGQFSSYSETPQNTIGVSLGTIDHPYLAHMNVSIDQKDVITDLVSPSTIHVDFDMSYNTTNMLILDHVQSCYPHKDDGQPLPYSKSDDQNGIDDIEAHALTQGVTSSDGKPVGFYNSVMNVSEISDSHVWVIELHPYSDRYWIKCTLLMPAGAINETFVRRRINVLNLHPNDMFSRVDKFTTFDDEELEGQYLDSYRGMVERFINPDYGRAWQRKIAVRSEIDTASGVEVDDGTIGDVHASDVDQNPKTVMEWDDVRYAQVRDILYLVIPGLFGLGLAFLLKPENKRRKKAEYLPN